jgi:glycosyltransferase involved in cell wall biosynthesis
MKLLLTLDFPPEIGGIQKHLENIVCFTYDSEDLVMVGCRAKPLADLLPGLRARIDWISGPFSRRNKKFALAPMLVKYTLLVFAKSELFEVECGNVYAAAVPWIASFLTGIHYNVYVHGTELLGLREKTLRARIIRLILKKARTIIANSAYTASLIKSAGLEGDIVLSPPKIALPAKILQNLTTARTFDAGAPKRPMRILCVGRLVEHKGHEVLLEAVSMMPGNISWLLTIVGDGPLKKDLADYCRAKNLQDRVSMYSEMTESDLASEYEKASVFVLPSLEVMEGVEGFGIVLLEAMAHGVPIIASFVGGVSEVLDGGSCGILVEAGNSTALAHALLKLDKDKAERARLIANAYERVRTMYAW